MDINYFIEDYVSREQETQRQRLVEDAKKAYQKELNRSGYTNQAELDLWQEIAEERKAEFQAQERFVEDIAREVGKTVQLEKRKTNKIDYLIDLLTEMIERQGLAESKKKLAPDLDLLSESSLDADQLASNLDLSSESARQIQLFAATVGSYLLDHETVNLAADQVMEQFRRDILTKDELDMFISASIPMLQRTFSQMIRSIAYQALFSSSRRTQLADELGNPHD